MATPILGCKFFTGQPHPTLALPIPINSNEQRIKTCVSRFDSGSYTRIQFLRAVSRSVGTHAGALQPRHNESSSEEDDADDMPSATALGPIPAAATGTTSTSTATPAAAADNCREVCLIGQRDGVALVPCGHVRFCAPCVGRVVTMGTG